MSIVSVILFTVATFAALMTVGDMSRDVEYVGGVGITCLIVLLALLSL